MINLSFEDFILAEKPKAATAIAKALGNAKLKQAPNKNKYWTVDNKVCIASAVGHLYNLHPKIAERGIFPKWEALWCPSWKINPKLNYLKNYFECIKYLVSNNTFDRYIIATDNDIEGTVIGFVTLFGVLKVPFEKGYRMRMNSLAVDEVKRAYRELLPPDTEWFSAGFARHETDFLWGINLTEAFSKAFNLTHKRWKTLSLGRVQSPSLKFLVDREREIQSFVPQTYWNVKATIVVEEKQYEAWCSLGDIKTKPEADLVVSKCKGLNALVTAVDKNVKEYLPPLCFSISTLEQEAWYKLKFRPDVTDSVAQSLYTQALVSYPRTGSTSVMFVPTNSILESLKTGEYSEFANEITNNHWTPRKGGYYDGAHTAIYPTSERNKPRNDYEQKLLDLIRRRFLGTFYPPVKRELTEIKLTIGEVEFTLKGEKTIETGWLKPYTYSKFEEVESPELTVGNNVQVLSVEAIEKVTKPPFRYSYASLVKEMEKHNIGTKATRATICKTLWLRGYILSEKGVGVKPLPLGVKLIEVAEKFVPKIIDVKLTAELEQDLEDIEKKIKTKNQVIQKSKENLERILSDITNNLEKIGEELSTV